MLDYYLHRHLSAAPCAPAPHSSSGSSPRTLQASLVLVEARGLDCRRPEAVLAELVNCMIRMQQQDSVGSGSGGGGGLDGRRHVNKKATSSSSSAIPGLGAEGGAAVSSSISSSSGHGSRHKQNKYLRNFLPPAVLLRQLYEAVVEHQAFTKESPGHSVTSQLSASHGVDEALTAG